MKTRIQNYIKAGYPGLNVVSFEENRVEAIIHEIISDINKKSKESEQFTLMAWSVTDGVSNITESGAKINDTQEPVEMLKAFMEADDHTVLIARDFHPFMEDRNPLVHRKVKDALTHGKSHNKMLVMVGCRLCIPPELEKEITVLDFTLPDREQLKTVLRGLLESNGQKKPIEDEVGILHAAMGLTTIEAENAFALSVVERGKVERDVVYREKCQTVRKNGLLEVVDSKVTLADIGGLEALKHWLVQRADAFGDEAKAYGLPTPRGFLAVGQPGTGKTLTAKAVASVLQVPHLRLDAAKLFGSLVGQTEANWRMVHATAKAMAPCVLHIDEVDGAMAGGSSSGQTDGGTTVRVIKSILQDMQDNSEGIFYVLTANDVDALPAPLLRRMDEVWNVELPNLTEREAIWSIQIRKFKRDPANFNLKELATTSDGYSGAEIEKVIAQSLYAAFADKHREVDTGDMGVVMRHFKPLSVTMAADIEKRRKRLEGVAKLASAPVVAAAPRPARKIARADEGTVAA